MKYTGGTTGGHVGAERAALMEVVCVARAGIKMAMYSMRNGLRPMGSATKALGSYLEEPGNLQTPRERLSGSSANCRERWPRYVGSVTVSSGRIGIGPPLRKRLQQRKEKREQPAHHHFGDVMVRTDNGLTVRIPGHGRSPTRTNLGRCQRLLAPFSCRVGGLAQLDNVLDQCSML